MTDEATAGSGSTTATMVFRGDDLEPLDDAIDGLPLDTTRLGAGPGRFSLGTMQFESSALVVGRFVFAVMTRGECLPGTHTLVVPLTEADGSWNAIDIDEDALWSYGPAAEHEGNASHPPRWAAMSLQSGSLPTPPRGSVEVLRNHKVRDFTGIITSAADALEQGRLTDDMLPSLESELLGSVGDVFDAPHTEQPRPRASARIVRECLDRAGEIDRIPIVGELAESLGISDRWIRSAFMREFNVSPSTFFRVQSLQRAHRELVSSDVATTSVTEVAMSNGFWHLGRFSAAYRDAFGELPSNTLARQR